jgi:lysophospholipase L1-like esterase
VGFSNNPGLYPDSTIIIKNQDPFWAKGRYFERIDDFKNNPIGYGKIVFLGNSIIRGGGDWNKRLGVSNIVNRGISGDITEGVLERVNEIWFYKPVAVFLLIGFNNFFTDYKSNPEITPNYVYNNIILIAKNIKKMSPNTEIYIQTIMPMNNKKYIETTASYPFLADSYKPSINTQIKKVNKLLRENRDFNIIDLHPYFKNENGTLILNLSDDGVHPNENGYSTWVDILKPYIKNIQN